MSRIWHERKNVVGKWKLSNKSHQLDEKCNTQHVSISCVVQLIGFN